MATILIIASILIVTFIIRAIIKRDTDRDGSMKRDTDRDGSMKRDTDRDGSMNKSVSWEYVKSNLSWAAEHSKQCPKCGLESDKLHWFIFRSSDDSWLHLAGREGFYSMCPDCKIEVEKIFTKMG